MKSFSSICLKIAGSTMLASMILYAGEATAITQLFLGQEYQGQSGSNAGTIRGGDPASDAAFANWLTTAGLTTADVTNDVSTIASGATGAVWGAITDPGATTDPVGINIGGTTVNAQIAGWDTNTNTQVGASGNAVLDGFGNNTSTLQSGAARPGFASGSGSGSYIGTNNGATSDGILNAVSFDFSGFTGGGVFSFGLFGGDLETGAPGSPEGFLKLNFADGSMQTINYTPDATLFPDAVFSGTGNNQSETYGNETGRFIGISGDQLISSALFVVGDDDRNDDADSEQLSFIAPMVFLNAAGEPVTATEPIPTPALLPGLIGFGASILRKRRQTA